MADDSSYNIVVLQILVVSIVFRIESIAQCQDENDLKKLHETTAVGSSVELACNITNPEFASWLGEDQGGLTLGFIVYSRWRNSYSLRTVSTANVSNYFLYKLVVHNVTEDVEGFYLCQEEGCQKAKINLTVEVPPVLWLEREHSNISNIINVTLNQETDIRCKAVGGKPTVSLLWEINGEDETDGVTSETTPNEVTSTLNYKPNIDDRMVTCKSSGQIAVPSLRTSVNINVLYPPTCHILVNKDSTSTYKVTCVCVANPEVSLSVLIVNNFPYESDTVSLPVTLSAKIYCRAENGVGVCESPVHTHTPLVTPTALPIETNQPLNEQSTSFLKHPLPILLVISTTIMITATALTVAIVMTKRSSTTECNRTSTERYAIQNISCSMYDQFQPVSKHGFIDTSDCRYETRFFREGIAVKDLSKGRTEPTGGKVAEGDTPEYVEVLDESARDTHRRRDK